MEINQKRKSGDNVFVIDDAPSNKPKLNKFSFLEKIRKFFKGKEIINLSPGVTVVKSVLNNNSVVITLSNGEEIKRNGVKSVSSTDSKIVFN